MRPARWPTRSCPTSTGWRRRCATTGGTVIWIQTAYTDETLTSWSTLYGMVGPKGAERAPEVLAVAGSKGYELFPDLKVEPTDLIVEKNRYSAFIQGSSNIEEVLRSRGLDTLLITGTVTNVCCESTARDAMMRNFKTIMITDGNAANTDEDHNAALNNFYLTFGDIMSTDFAIGCLTRNAQKGLAAAEWNHIRFYHALYSPSLERESRERQRAG